MHEQREAEKRCATTTALRAVLAVGFFLLDIARLVTSAAWTVLVFFLLATVPTWSVLLVFVAARPAFLAWRTNWLVARFEHDIIRLGLALQRQFEIVRARSLRGFLGHRRSFWVDPLLRNKNGLDAVVSERSRHEDRLAEGAANRAANDFLR
jgi:hypothetical protein